MEDKTFWGLEVESLHVSPRICVSDGYEMTEEHAHQYHELMFNFSGIPIRHTVSGHTYETDTPYILYHAPYVLHSSCTLSEQPFRRYLLAIHPCILTEYDGICDLGNLRSRRKCLIPTTPEQMDVLEQLLSRLSRRWDPRVPKNAWMGTLATLLYEVSELVPHDLQPEAPAPPYIQEMLHYVAEHTEDDLTTQALAQRFFVSHAKLTKDFRMATNLSLHEYVTAIRIARAKIWLAEGMPLSFIAERCGFSQESSFICMFRRGTGMTPGEYRRKLR